VANATRRERLSSLAVLNIVLEGANEAVVAAQLHMSVGTLRRLKTGAGKMTWVTRTRLERIADELAAHRAAHEAHQAAARERLATPNRRERPSGSYPRVPSPAVAVG
jgi:hypothetical protein